MNKKIFVKTLLTTSTVGLLGGGIAASLVLTSCSKKTEPSNFEIKRAPGSDISGPAGTALTVKGTFTGNKAIHLVQPSPFVSFEPNMNEHTFKATLPNNYSDNTYDLVVANADGLQSTMSVVLTKPVVKTLQIENVDKTELIKDDHGAITGQIILYNFTASDLHNIIPSEISANYFDVKELDSSTGTFEVALWDNIDIGVYPLQFLDVNTNIYSNIIPINVVDEVVTFTTAAETLDYLEKNSTNCSIATFDTYLEGGGIETIIDVDEYTSYINEYVTQKVLLDALIYTVAFVFEGSIFDNSFPSLDFSTNYVHASYWNEEEEAYPVDIYANLNKFNSFEDFYVVYSETITMEPFGIFSKNNYATYIDISHTGEGIYPLFLYWSWMPLALSPFDFTNITYNIVPEPEL